MKISILSESQAKKLISKESEQREARFFKYIEMLEDKISNLEQTINVFIQDRSGFNLQESS